MVHNRLAERGASRAEEVGEDIHAVFASVVRQGLPDDRGACRKQVGQTDRVEAGRCRGRILGQPARDERDAVAPLENVGLGASILSARMMTESGQGFEVGGRRAAIVTREDDQRIRVQSRSLESTHDLANRRINLQDEIAVRADPALLQERAARNDRRVGRRQREIQKEGTSVGRLRPGVDELDRLARDRSHNVLCIEVGSGLSLANVGLLCGRLSTNRSLLMKR